MTVEDYNSNNDFINEFYQLDTSDIDTDEFNNVLYDFCIVSHSISGDTHTFTFEVVNSLWDGGYTVVKKNPPYLVDFTAEYSDGIIFIETDEDSILLFLHLCDYTSFEFKEQKYIAKYYTGPVGQWYVEFAGLDNTTVVTTVPTRLNSTGVHTVTSTQYGDVQVLVLGYKETFPVNQNTPAFSPAVLNVGSENKVYFNTTHWDGDTDYLDAYVVYNGVTTPVLVDNAPVDPYFCCYFIADLSDKLDDNPVDFKLVVNETSKINSSTYDFKLPCSYPVATSFSELKSLINTGFNVIRVDGEITFSSDLIISHDVYLIGDDDVEVDLNSYSILLNECNVRFDNISFSDGNPCLIQTPGSNLTCNNCSFSNCSIRDEYKGSVLSTLDGENIVTSFNTCSILNCPHSIYHCGSLTIHDMRWTQDNTTNIDTDYSIFLTTYDGNTNITQSKFNYTIEYNADLKFAISLIGLSEETILNGILGEKLKQNNTIPILNNTSNTNVTYIHNENTITTEALIDNKNLCHTIINEDTIYKNNLNIRRVI